MGALPSLAEDVLRDALVCEFTVIDGRGRPVTHPMIPLYDGGRVFMTSSALFSRKLDHIRTNPKVALSVTDPVACPNLSSFARVTVQGDAVIREDDPHRDWERILPLWTAKEPAVEAFLAKRVALPLFWERALIEITPSRCLIWPDGRTDRAPEIHEAVNA